MTENSEGLAARVIRTAAQSLHLLVTTAVILGLAYVLGRTLLVGPVGNDAPLHISYATWIARYFPDIPDWYPLHGGGMSIGRAYPLMGHYLLAFIHLATGLSVLQAYHLVTFLAVPATALGIYLFCWSALRSQTVGLVAASFYMLSPMAWVWTHEHGYLAQAVGSVFVPLALLAFDRYVSLAIEGGTDLSRRLWFVAFVVLAGLGTLGHMFAGGAIAVGLVLYAALIGLLTRTGDRLRTLRVAMRAVLTCGLCVILLVAFWFMPLVSYNRIATLGGMRALPPDELNQPHLLEILGLTPSGGSPHWIADASFAVLVVALSVLGLLLGGFYSRRAFALAVIAWVATVSAGTMEIRSVPARLWEWLQVPLSERTFLLLAQVVLPIGAAYGTWALAKTVLRPLGLIRRHEKRSESTRPPHGFSWRALSASTMTLLIAATSAYLLRNISTSEPDLINYGLSRTGFRTADVWRGSGEGGGLAEQLAPSNWPPLEIAEGDPAIDAATWMADLLPDKDLLRVDLSPFLGRYAQNLVSVADVSQINTYSWNANLNLALWSYQVNVFFNESPPEQEFGSPKTLNELAGWYGTEYVFIRSDEDPNSIYQSAGWERVMQDGAIELWRNPDAPMLASLSSRPTILVISREEMDLYQPVFRVANRGAMPYEHFWVVQGRGDVDSYSLEELQRFDALFLNGYSYSNSARAWAILDEYVRNGGALYVDTGWQWTVPEWEFLHAPPVLPVSTLKWTNYGMTSDYGLEAPNIGGELDPDQFSPLVWESGPWAVSGARLQDVRNWGQVVLSGSGQPLIVAGEYGEGRVVWSGMNLVAHSNDKQNEEEARLLHNLVAWLTGGTGGADYPVRVLRDHPDRVEFDLNVPSGESPSLYWREAYYPAWHAYVRTPDGGRQELPIYRGGPGFMLMPIDGISGEVSIELVWETPLIERLAALISLMTLAALGAFVADGVLFGGKRFAALHHRLRWPRRGAKPKGRVEWLPELGAATNSGGLGPPGAGQDSFQSRAPRQRRIQDHHDPIDEGIEASPGATMDPISQADERSSRLPTSEDPDASSLISHWRRLRELDDDE